MYYFIATLTIIALICTVWFANENDKKKVLAIVLATAFVLTGFGLSYDMGYHSGKSVGDKQVAEMIEKQDDLVYSTQRQVIENLANDLPAVAGEVYTVIGKGNDGTATADLIIVTGKQKDGQPKIFRTPSALKHETLPVGSTLFYSGSSWTTRSL